MVELLAGHWFRFIAPFKNNISNNSEARRTRDVFAN